MTGHITVPRERLSTEVTVVRFLTRMYEAVTRQLTAPSERLAAYVAAVRSLACVYAAVIRQIIEQTEHLIADVTTVRPLSGMSDQMTPQMTRIVRGVLARLALVLAVPPDVTVTSLHVLIQRS